MDANLGLAVAEVRYSVMRIMHIMFNNGLHVKRRYEVRLEIRVKLFCLDITLCRWRFRLERR